MTTSRASSLPRRRAAQAAAVQSDPRWDALVRRDPSADGAFFYSVASTGVYCRPSCAARRPRPDNVAFHESAEAARAAGYRPCRRCRPDEPPLAEDRARWVAAVCELIDAAPEPPRLEELARRSGWSPFHLLRVFRSVTGMTPAAYAAARRAERVRAGLAAGASVTAALYAAGFNSSGPFYAAAEQALGMSPSDYRRGGKGQRIRFAVGQCSLGAILVAASERGVCAITLGDEPEALVRDLERRFPAAELLGGDDEFEALVATVVGFVEAPGVGLGLPLDLRGTLFQERVWRSLAEIPPGTTTTYTELAERIGAPGAVRAVARACAGNRLAVAIPCHRVVRKDGGLSGYRWGVERKRSLLAREAAAAGVLPPPAAAPEPPKATPAANVLDRT